MASEFILWLVVVLDDLLPQPPSTAWGDEVCLRELEKANRLPRRPTLGLTDKELTKIHRNLKE